MKKTAIISLSLMAAFSGFAQANLDANAIRLMEAARVATSPASRSGEIIALESDKFENVAVFITMEDASDIEAVKAMGVEVMDARGDMAIVAVTPEQLLQLAESDFITDISGSEMAYTLLNEARVATGVDEIHKGTGLPKAYTGEGVIVGMMDTGLDINHVNFLKDVDAYGYFSKNPGTDIPNRATRVWYIVGNSVQTYDTPEKIAKLTTDVAKETHGTHVLGIAAGSFKGRMAAPTLTTSGGVNTSSKPCPFYGVATGAELAVASGTLQGTNINTAIGKISDYAKSVGKPVAMNLSLGHTSGPHDGTTAANKYMSEMGKEMIICVSAGNEGDMPIAIEKTLGAGTTAIKSCLAQSGNVNGGFSIWSSDSDPLSITFVIMDKDTKQAAWSKKLDLKAGTAYYLTGTYYNVPSYDKAPQMDSYFGEKAAIVFTPNVNENNNRYNVSISCQISCESADNAKRYIPALYVEGKSGAKVCMYGNSATAWYSNGFAGFTDGTNDGSINDMACAENVIAVGAYVNRVKWPINGNQKGSLDYSKYYSEGEIAEFSSFGTTADGRKLPHITAPGMFVLSSMSNYYYKQLGEKDEDYLYFVCSIDEGTKRNRSSYWMQMSGTSMSAPFVTGVMALWLQADPTLTVQEAKQILAETAIKDKYTSITPERWGAGKIDALAGLKRVLSASSGINDVASEGREILINQVGDNSYDLFCPGADEIRADLYTISGMHVASRTAKGETMVFTPEASNGIYILRVAAGDRTATQKVTLR